ncbi:MAG: DegV family protein [Lachnospiraceae bacterium]|nr:DegV family protein [Lachnospiraceae bacterium]
MREIRIMADVNADTTPEFVEKENIGIMPQYYHFNDGVIYGDGNGLKTQTFFDRLASGERAYSMGCNPDRVHGIMEQAVLDGCDIIVYMASSDCSGSYNTVRVEAESLMGQYKDARIYVMDSRLECAPIGLLVKQAVALKKAGRSFDEIVRITEELKSTANVFFLVDHLDYLVRGGRLSPISGAVGTVLNIKPILYFEDGKIVPFTKVRGRAAGKKRIMEQLGKLDPKTTVCSVVHTVAEEEAKAFAEQIEQELGLKVVSIDEVNPTIGAHAGHNAIGVAYCGTAER